MATFARLLLLAWLPVASAAYCAGRLGCRPLGCVRAEAVRCSVGDVPENEPQPLLTKHELEDGWRSFRHKLITDGTFVPTTTQAVDAADGGWVHRLHAPEAGCILLPKPNVLFTKAPLLDRSVLLLLQHDEHGSLAIALNRPTDGALGDVLEHDDLCAAFGAHPLHLGGTAADAEGAASEAQSKANVWMLAETEGATRREHEECAGSDDAEQLLPGLWLASALGAARRVNAGLTPRDKFHFYAGAFVWGPGELEEEFDEARAWSAVAASAPMISSMMLGGDLEPETKYQAALAWLEDADAARGASDGGAADTDDAGVAGGLAGVGGASSARLQRKRGGDLAGLQDVMEAVHTWVGLLREEAAAADDDDGDDAARDAARAGAAPAGTTLHGPSLSEVAGVAHDWMESGRPEASEDMGTLFDAVVHAPVAALARECAEMLQTARPPSARGGDALGEAAAAAKAAPRFALHCIRCVLLSTAGARVVPNEQPALHVDDLSLIARLEALAAALPQPGRSAPTPRRRAPVDVSSLQLALAVKLVAERLGLDGLDLVDVKGCGLLLKATLGGDGGAGEDEPLYLSLAPGPSCLRTLSASDVAPPAPPPPPPPPPLPRLVTMVGLTPPTPVTPPSGEGDGAADGDGAASSAPHHPTTLDGIEEVLEPFDIGSLLVAEWSEAFRAAGDAPRADFWEVQRHLLKRLADRLKDHRDGGSRTRDRDARRTEGVDGGGGAHGMKGGRGGSILSGTLDDTFSGFVVRTQRDEDDDLYFDI